MCTSLCFQELKPYENNPRLAKHCTVCCYCSKENAIWTEQICYLNTERNKVIQVYVLASVPFPSLLFTTYTHNHVSHQIKANFCWNQMWILFKCAYCIKKYCSVRLKTNLKKVPKPQFNVLSLPRFNFSLATWKLGIYPYWQVCKPKLFYYPFI